MKRDFDLLDTTSVAGSARSSNRTVFPSPFPLVAIPVFLGVIIALLLGGCTAGPDSRQEKAPPAERKEPALPEPENIYQSVSAAIAAGNPEEAIRKYEEAKASDADSLRTKLELAKLNFYAARLEEAGRLFEEVLAGLEKAEESGAAKAGEQLSPRQEAEAHYFLALIAGLNEDTKLRRQRLGQALEADPSFVDARASLGELELTEGNKEKAEKAFQRVLEEDKDNLVALTGLGNIKIRDSEFEKARGYLDRVIAQEPEISFPYADRGRVLESLNKPAAADRDLSRAIEMNPDYYWHYIDRGKLRLRAGHPEAAREDFSRAIELNPEIFYPYVYRAGINKELGSLEAAIDDYREVIEKKPEYHFSYFPLAQIYYMQQEWNKARARYLDAFEHEGQRYEAVLLAGLTYLKTDQKNQAKELLEAYLGKFPRETLYYEMARYLMVTSNDGYITEKVNNAKDELLRHRMLFYLGVTSLMQEKEYMGRQYLKKVTEYPFPSFPEYELAEWELSRLNSENRGEDD
ncbi:MAG: tetratricopeptide repeat protein [Spirochaetales bacterium]|nr:tetratricopeptide repeat protein [Spirochaetales bacterium]MCF7938055.1 tetratricopeptide repeat protein [Spirochaetales bacterium]